jgi:hypothetical protein
MSSKQSARKTARIKDLDTRKDPVGGVLKKK